MLTKSSGFRLRFDCEESINLSLSFSLNHCTGEVLDVAPCKHTALLIRYILNGNKWNLMKLQENIRSCSLFVATL